MADAASTLAFPHAVGCTTDDTLVGLAHRIGTVIVSDTFDTFTRRRIAYTRAAVIAVTAWHTSVIAADGFIGRAAVRAAKAFEASSRLGIAYCALTICYTIGTMAQSVVDIGLDRFLWRFGPAP